MERREVLKLVALAALSSKLNALEGAAAACSMNSDTGAPSPGEYKLQFFTEDENKLVDQLMEMIIPVDSHSPGAHAAKASLFADQMIASGDDAVKTHWRDGLQLIREQAKDSSLAKALQKAAESEENPKTELDRFFVSLKQMTVNGYYTSEIGIQQDLEYAGNTYLPRFPECTHPEHQG
jgi:gluconate 2-dehydrogenase gamma chain